MLQPLARILSPAGIRANGSWSILLRGISSGSCRVVSVRSSSTQTDRKRPRRTGSPNTTARSYNGGVVLSPYNGYHTRLHHHHQLQQQQLPLLQNRRFATDETFAATTVVVDYFEIFGLPRSFRVDPKTLKQSYLKLMNEHHPDKQLQHQPTDDNDNDEKPSVTAETITHAYQTLGSPHTRALHWLDLHGSPLLEEDRGRSRGVDDNGTGENDNNSMELVGMEFLMEIMEWREAIEEAGSDQAALAEISRTTGALHERCVADLGDLLDGYTGVGGDNGEAATTLRDARRLTAQLQYWYRLERTLRDATEVG